MKDLGVLVPVVTPCSPAGEPDLNALKAVCADMLDAGCAGIFVAGSTGRGPWFGLNERVAVCRAAAEGIGPNVPLFAGCMGTGLPGMLENARAMADAGASYAVATAPTYFNYNQEEIQAIFLKFADASPLPVVVYDIPAFAGIKLDLGPVLRLAAHGNIVGFKDSSSDFDRFKELADALRDVQEFWLLQGKEPLLAVSLQAGASGFVVSHVHFGPRVYVEIYRAVKAGENDRVRALQERITEVAEIVNSAWLDVREESSTLFHLLDVALRKRGLCRNILLEHEGKTSAEMAAAARRAVELLEQ